MKQFPAYQSAAIAARWGCFRCFAPLDMSSLHDEAYPDGRGRYSMQCPRCSMRTWFDLEPVALILKEGQPRESKNAN